jgi:hypothetical protein
VFLPPAVGEGPLPDEPEQVASHGSQVRRSPAEADRPVDVYDAVDAVGGADA